MKSLSPNVRPTALVAVSMALALAACQTAAPQRRAGTARPQTSTAVQAVIGVAKYDNFEFEVENPGGGERAIADLSQMPLLGFAGQYALGGDNVEYGFDGGLLFSWESDSQTVAVGSGTAVIVSDVDLLVIDLFFGGYASMIVGDRFRLYGGAGPTLMWGEADYRDQLGSEDASAFGVGYYLRAGAEFRLADRAFMGLGARWVDTTLAFGGRVGDVDAEGIQAFLTYTQGF